MRGTSRRSRPRAARDDVVARWRASRQPPLPCGSEPNSLVRCPVYLLLLPRPLPDTLPVVLGAFPGRPPLPPPFPPPTFHPPFPRPPLPPRPPLAMTRLLSLPAIISRQRRWTSHPPRAHKSEHHTCPKVPCHRSPWMAACVHASHAHQRHPHHPLLVRTRPHHLRQARICSRLGHLELGATSRARPRASRPKDVYHLAHHPHRAPSVRTNSHIERRHNSRRGRRLWFRGWDSNPHEVSQRIEWVGGAPQSRSRTKRNALTRRPVL